MNGNFYDGYVLNSFYPSRSQAASPQKGFSSIGLTNWMKIAAIVIMVMLFILNILDVVTIALNNRPPAPSSDALSSDALSSDAPVDSGTCPCPGTSNQSLFFPYGLEAGDAESFSDITFPIDSSIVYTVFGNNQNAKPVVLQTSLGTALIKVGYYEDLLVADPYAKIFFLNAATVQDPTDDADRHTYYRRATKSDEQIINCIIPNFTTSEAYVVTWVNVNDTKVGELGTFQGIVAFGANSDVYLIRNYGPDVSTLLDSSKPMKIVDKPAGINYEADSIVADFLGKREILLISVFSATQTFPRITEQLTTTEC